MRIQRPRSRRIRSHRNGRRSRTARTNTGSEQLHVLCGYRAGCFPGSPGLERRGGHVIKECLDERGHIVRAIQTAQPHRWHAGPVNGLDDGHTGRVRQAPPATSTPSRSTTTCPPASGEAAAAGFRTRSRTLARAGHNPARALGQPRWGVGQPGHRRVPGHYRCFAPGMVAVAVRATPVCRRWGWGDGFQGAKEVSCLDKGQLTCWNSWHRRSMVALVACVLPGRRRPRTAVRISRNDHTEAGLLPLGSHEPLRPYAPDPGPPRRDTSRLLWWSTRRRHHRHRARLCHRNGHVRRQHTMIR